VAPVEIAPAFSANAWATAIGADDLTIADEAARARANGHGAVQEDHATTEAAQQKAESLAVEHDAVASAIDRFAETKDPFADQSPLATGSWEVQALRASRLASTWDAPAPQIPTFAPPAPPAVLEPVKEENLSSAQEPAAQEPAAQEAATTEALVQEAPAVVEGSVSGGSAPSTSAVESFVDEPPAAEPHDEASAAQSPASEEFVSEAASHAPAAEQSAYAAEPVEPEAPSTTESAAQEAPVSAYAEERATEAVEHAPAVPHLAEAVTAAVDAAPEAIASTSSEPSTEDVVAKVLANLDPSVMQALTRQLLKPVVEAMVREELNKKK
jgi:hypothetical protein